MIRFNCFHTDVHSNKPKKIMQPSVEAMGKALQDSPKIQDSKNNCMTASSTPLLSEAQEGEQLNIVDNHGNNLTSINHNWSSENLKSKLVNGYDNEIHHTAVRLKKCLSVESGLYQEGRLYADNFTEDDADPVLSCNGPESHSGSTISCYRMGQYANPADKGKANQYSDIHVSSGLGNNGSIFSIGDPTPLDKDVLENSDTSLFGGCAGDHTSGRSSTTLMLKSCSVPNFMASTLSSEICSFDHAFSRSRSSEDLQVSNMRLKDSFINESDDQVNEEQARDNKMVKTEEIHMGSSVDDGYDAYQLSGSTRDCVMPVIDDINVTKTLQGESSVEHLDDLANKDFMIKRIEDWVTGLEHCEPLEETNEPSKFVGPFNEDVISTTGSVTASRVDGNVTPGMEAAKRCISSLSPNATAAHLANYGLVVIPFLSAFATLKVLNLSGNAIVRITAGALPRGLHVLNLSKNNISTIEGLRELTRLRVLDLSYNRILRIGHGLASCSSLKELYLAGNKISEVEGLHRLLKLTVLDLRFNKISTAKCFGQLAANYNSLQAINLEGNPAQKNVGNEQLKKYLQGLLPHLVYYNQQPSKSSTLKDGTDRCVRLSINSHQFDRSLRSDHKTTRKGKGSHGAGPAGARKPLTASTLARKNLTVESSKHSRGRQGLLPPPVGGSKGSSRSRHHFDVVGKLLNLRQGLSIRKSRSEEAIRAL